MLFAKVTGYIKDKFAGGNRTVAVSKVKGLGNDSQVLHCFAPGVEINPADNSNLAIQMVGGFSVAVGGVNQDIEPDTERGEKRFFSTDDTGKGIKAIVKFLCFMAIFRSRAGFRIRSAGIILTRIFFEGF